MVADLDMLGGHVDDAFNRLVDLVRRTAGDERDQAREHLLGLFGAVGNDDPRVLRGRQNLASALFELPSFRASSETISSQVEEPRERRAGPCSRPVSVGRQAERRSGQAQDGPHGG